MILSYLNLGVGNLIPFFYTPIMLELLGQSEYGLYKIAGSTTSYLSLMAFGIGSAVSRFIIKARTQEGKEAEERMFGLFNLLFQAVALLTLIVGGIIVWKLDLIYGASLTAAELSRMQILVGLMVINTAVSFSATSYNAVVSSHERFLFIHSINILSTIGAPVLNLVILFMGYRSVGMAVVSLSLNIIVRLVYIAFVRKSLDIRPRYKGMPTHAIREIFEIETDDPVEYVRQEGRFPIKEVTTDENGDLLVDIHRNKQENPGDYDRIFAAKIAFDRVVL